MTRAVDADLHVAVDGFALDARFDVGGSEVLAVVGPNGAGKSTLLRTLAGIVRATSGTLELDGRPVDGPSVFLPAHHRSVGYVPQHASLFPFASVLDNVAFGPRRSGRSKRDARRDAHSQLEAVGLDGLADRPASTLSGGEARRVAIARALARGPKLLLLDEPFTGLDVEAARHTRTALRAAMGTHRGATVLVTHDAADALTLADRFLVLEAGRVSQLASSEEIRRAPRSRYAADFVGLNHLEGRLTGGRVAVGPETWVVAAELPTTSGDVIVVIPPRAVALHRRTPEGSPRNVWAGTVTSIDDEGDRVRISVDGVVPLVADVTPDAVSDLALEPGAGVYMSVKATEISVQPA